MKANADVVEGTSSSTSPTHNDEDDNHSASSTTTTTTTAISIIKQPITTHTQQSSSFSLFEKWKSTKHVMKMKIEELNARMVSILKTFIEYNEMILKYVLILIAFMIIFIILFSTFMITSSMIIYYLFFSYRPLLHYSYPLHFSSQQQQQQQLSQSATSLYANIPLRKEQQEHFFSDWNQKDKIRIENIQIHMDFPENEMMMDSVGMFELKLHILVQQQSDHNIVHTVHSTTCMMEYRSSLIRVLDSIIYSPLYLLRFKQQKQSKIIPMLISSDTTHVSLFNHYIQHFNSTMIVVEICDRRVQFYATSSTIHFHSNVIGWRYYTYHYKWIIWLFIIFPCLTFIHSITSLLTVISLFYYLFIHYYNSNNNKNNQNNKNNKNKKKNNETTVQTESATIYDEKKNILLLPTKEEDKSYYSASDETVGVSTTIRKRKKKVI